MTRRGVAAALAVWLAAGCAAPVRTAPTPAAGAAPSAAVLRTSALRWMRTSAEYGAITRQTFAAAAGRLVALAPAVSGAAWGVILDADETVLDNSGYEVRRARVDSAYTEQSWSAWVRDTMAVAVPGAVVFTRRVHALGGRVVIVSNRADSLCAFTRVNLRRVGVDPDLVLCQPGSESDKNPRFDAVQRGTASTTLPALVVLEWIGDNIQDFPRFTQSVSRDPAAMALFGTRYFAIPNPVYGSWESSPDP